MGLTGINRYRTNTRVACPLLTSSDCRTRYLSDGVVLIHGVSSTPNGADKAARFGRIKALQVISGLHGCLDACLFSTTIVCQVYVSLTTINPQGRIELLVVLGGTIWMSIEDVRACCQRFSLCLRHTVQVSVFCHLLCTFTGR
jgi:hypothetical protein